MCADMTGSIIDQYVFRNLLYQRVLTLSFVFVFVFVWGDCAANRR